MLDGSAPSASEAVADRPTPFAHFAIAKTISIDKSGIPQLRFEGAVEVEPLAMDSSQDEVYFPITMNGRLIACQNGVGSRLMASGLREFMELLGDSREIGESPTVFPNLDRNEKILGRFRPGAYEHSDDLSQWRLYLPDGGSLEWKLMGSQVAMIHYMYERLCTPFPEAHFEEILAAANIDSNSKSAWQDRWRSRKGLMGSLIVGNGRGFYRLNIELGPRQIRENTL